MLKAQMVCVVGNDAALADHDLDLDLRELVLLHHAHEDVLADEAAGLLVLQHVARDALLAHEHRLLDLLDDPHLLLLVDRLVVRDELADLVAEAVCGDVLPALLQAVLPDVAEQVLDEVVPQQEGVLCQNFAHLELADLVAAPLQNVELELLVCALEPLKFIAEGPPDEVEGIHLLL